VKRVLRGINTRAPPKLAVDVQNKWLSEFSTLFNHPDRWPHVGRYWQLPTGVGTSDTHRTSEKPSVWFVSLIGG
jgi:hypothetical protein